MIVLHKIVPGENVYRFYCIGVQPSLLEPYGVLRIWGRIGGGQQKMYSRAGSEAEARQLAHRLLHQKLKAGYIIVYSHEA